LERIVELHFDTKDGLRILVCELFSKGNFVICDGAYKILNCASVQTWKDRTIKQGETYCYPPKGFNLLTLNQTVLHTYLNKYPHHEVVRLIATIGFGGTYAEEICIRAKIQKNKRHRLGYKSLNNNGVVIQNQRTANRCFVGHAEATAFNKIRASRLKIAASKQEKEA